MSDSQRRSTRIAAQPKKEEPPKPAPKPRKQSNKRPAAAEEGVAEGTEPAEKPATKKVRVCEYSWVSLKVFLAHKDAWVCCGCAVLMWVLAFVRDRARRTRRRLPRQMLGILRLPKRPKVISLSFLRAKARL